MRILIVDDNSNVRYGLKALFEELDEVEDIKEAVHCGELIRLIQCECPDLILLSWELPHQDDETFIKSIKFLCPDTHVVLMSSRVRELNEAFEIGADDFISKTEPPNKLLEVIQHDFPNSLEVIFRDGDKGIGMISPPVE